jgi:imidazole glycerol phosphate synthase glutamine amidotransferase subunit
MSDAVVVPTGTANLASVRAGLRRVGVSARLAEGPDDIAAASRVVLPGVGSFGAAMGSIDRRGLREPLFAYVEERRPILAICLGMQLLCSSSEESPGVEGLGVFDDRIRRLPETVRVPQLGWNTILPDTEINMVTRGWAYFANSYRMETIPRGWAGATAEYGGEFVAALERGAQLACQFHPELSGSWGAGLIRNWVDRTVSVV